MITVERRAHLGVGDGVGLSECFKKSFTSDDFCAFFLQMKSAH